MQGGVNLVSYLFVAAKSDSLSIYHFSVRETTSMEYPISCALMKVFNTKSSEILENCQLAFGFRRFSLSVAVRKRHFYNKYSTTDNALCQAITAFKLSSDYVANEEVIAKH